MARTMTRQNDKGAEFRRLHGGAGVLVLPNAWDAGSARVIESAGAAAIATTSAGLAWSHGYRDADRVPLAVLRAAVAEITRVVSVPVTIDVEGGYADDPGEVAKTVAAVIDGGAVGINIEDGAGSPDLLVAKITAVKAAASRAGVDLFVNVRTDVFLRGLVRVEAALDETIARARRYRAAGCDGVFVPGLVDGPTIMVIAGAVDAPLNVMISPGLPPVATLGELGVRRVSAGSAIAQAAYAVAKRATQQLLTDGRYDEMLASALGYGDLNTLFPPASA